MCGRFTYRFTWQQLARLMELLSWTEADLEPRFNVSPTQLAPVVRPGPRGIREGAMLRWGLVPSWADGIGVGGKNFNARSETIAQKPTFRDAFMRRRCLVPISGFYEWRALREGKQPFYITRTDGQPFALAGIWDRWSGAAGISGAQTTVETFSVLTTSPNALMRPLHSRMPVIIRPEDYQAWLGLDPTDERDAQRLFEPRDDLDYEAFAVGPMVSNTRNEGAHLIEKVTEFDPNEGFLF